MQTAGLLLFSLALFFTSCTFDTTGLKPVGPVCGDGVIDEGEQCDGNNLGGENCLSLGFAGGLLACSGACRFIVTGCNPVSTCGNGTIDPGEECDGTLLDGETCLSRGYSGGTLACQVTCRFDETGCTSILCGNGEIDPGEDCDGTAAFEETCETLGYYGGTLACMENCRFDPSSCMSFGTCGDGIRQEEHGEECDLDELGQQTCEDLGYYGGTLGCTGECTFDLTSCMGAGRCGDGILQPADEQCDGTFLGGATCENLGYYGGTLGCLENCLFNLEPCAAAGRCGDGVIQSAHGEQCDTASLGGNTCRSRGFFGGTLVCGGDCLLQDSNCDRSRLFGTNSEDFARDMAIDSAGNVYLVGTTKGNLGGTSAGGSDIVVVKWNVHGVHQWTRQMGTSGDDGGRAIVLEGDTAIYVTGFVKGNLTGQTGSGNQDAFLAKLRTSNGEVLWQRQFGSGGDSDGRALALDSDANVYVTGYTTGTVPSGPGNMIPNQNMGGFDVFLVSYSSAGNLRHGVMRGTTGDDYALGMVLSPGGTRLHITGGTTGAIVGGGVIVPGGGEDVFVLTYTLAGVYEHGTQFGTSSNDVGYDIVTDATHIYIAGYTDGSISGSPTFGGRDYFLAKLVPDAYTRVWTRQHGTSSRDEAYRLIRHAEKLYVTGFTEGAFSGYINQGSADVFLSRVDTGTGIIDYTRQYGSSGTDTGFGLARDPSGTICLSGRITGTFFDDPVFGNSDMGVWCVNP